MGVEMLRSAQHDSAVLLLSLLHPSHSSPPSLPQQLMGFSSVDAYWAITMVALRGVQSHLPDQMQVVGGAFEGFAELGGGNFDEAVRAFS